MSRAITRYGLGLVVSVLAVTVLLGGSVAACTDTTYSFDDVTIGGDDNSVEPRPRSNSQYVRAIYADLIGRTPEVYDLVLLNGGVEAGRFSLDEQAIVLQALDDVGDPTPMRALLATALVDSSEADVPEKGDVDDAAGFITEQFNKLLGREPNSYELQAFVDEWKSDSKVNPRTIIRALVGSREYQSY
jgi:hypothetical protein